MIVDEFIENPKPLSGFSNPENLWPDFLALLHLLLIKHEEKFLYLIFLEFQIMLVEFL